MASLPEGPVWRRCAAGPIAGKMGRPAAPSPGLATNSIIREEKLGRPPARLLPDQCGPRRRRPVTAALHQRKGQGAARCGIPHSRGRLRPLVLVGKMQRPDQTQARFWNGLGNGTPADCPNASTPCRTVFGKHSDNQKNGNILCDLQVAKTDTDGATGPSKPEAERFVVVIEAALQVKRCSTCSILPERR